LLFGSLLNDRNIAETETSVGAAYDPSTDSWRTLPPSELSPQATSAVDEEGVPCYGCPVAPLSYWVYRPPS
jgi:hypothetical protein